MSFVYMLMTASVMEDATDDGSNVEFNSYGIVLMLRVNKDESNFQFLLKGCMYLPTTIRYTPFSISHLPTLHLIPDNVHESQDVLTERTSR